MSKSDMIKRIEICKQRCQWDLVEVWESYIQLYYNKKEA